MAGASVSGLCPSISSSSIAFNEGFPNRTKAHLTPSFFEDLKNCQHCDVDQLLSVFLEHCRAINSSTNPLTPRITQSERNSQYSEAAPDGATVPNRNQKGAVDIKPVTHELLEVCLEKIITVCNGHKMKASIKQYQESHKEKPQYRPFVELANRALELVKPLEIPGLREASTSDILFDVNSNNAITKKGNVARFSDIVVVPLTSAQRVRGTTGSWDECPDQSSSRNSFNWPDVLLSAEMKWFHETLDYQQPAAYGTNLKLIYRPIPIHDEASKFTSVLSGEYVSNSNAHSGPSVSPSLDFAGSGSTYESPSLTKYQQDGVEAHRRVETSLPVEMSQPSGAFRGRKRTSDHLPQVSRATSKKPTLDKDSVNHAMKDNMREAMRQLSTNVAEMLRCSLGRRHALGMIIIDAIVWIWWFDRKGAIQSEGINIIEDLPRFLVLLFAFQRFTLADWGFDEQLDPSISPHVSTSQPARLEFDGEDGKFKAEFTFGPDIVLHNVFNLRGKSTTVFRVTSHLDNNNSGLVAKLHWLNQDHAHEADIIKRVRKDPEVANHLPCVFGSRDLGPVGTRHIRQELGIARSPRLPSIILFEQLHPITKLSGNQLVFAWLECIRCHYQAWENSIRHLDLSLQNLMLCPRNEPGSPKFVGVVNDWDLCDKAGNDNEKNLSKSRKDLTKTLLFTSLELLDAKPDEQVIQKYSHDLESFAWILIWVFLAVKEGKIEPIPEVAGWWTSHPGTSFMERIFYLSSRRKYKPHEEWEPYWLIAWDVAEWLRSRIPKDDLVAFYAHKKTQEKDETPEERKESLRKLLEIVRKRYEGDMPSSPEIPSL